MKKLILLTAAIIGLPMILSAQNDDLYYTPQKWKETVKSDRQAAKPAETVVTKRIETSSAVVPARTVIGQNRKATARDVDEYNRRPGQVDEVEIPDTIYIDEDDPNALEGEWVNGFEGTLDDYEYAERIIRFRNPRYAIPISSPYYWDVVYGLSPFDWNVYTDGFYAYAFPTFSNRLWWDWRWNSASWAWGPWGNRWNWGWNSWYGGGYWAGGYWPGYYGGWGHNHYWGGGYHWGGHHHWANAVRTDRRSPSRVSSSSRTGTINRSQYARTGTADRSQYTRSSTNPSRSSSGRVVGTRQSTSRTEATRPSTGATTRPSTGRVGYTRIENTNTNGRQSYTRPSTGGTVDRASRSTYSRGSSSSSRTYTPSNGSSSRSYSSSSRSSSSSSRSGSSYSSGSSSRSSSGSYSSGGGSSRSSSGGGGGSSRSGSRR